MRWSYKRSEQRNMRAVPANRIVDFLQEFAHLDVRRFYNRDGISCGPASMYATHGWGPVGDTVEIPQFKIGTRMFCVLAGYVYDGFSDYEIIEGTATSDHVVNQLPT